MKIIILVVTFFSIFIFSNTPVFGGTCVGKTCPAGENCVLDRSANPICVPNPGGGSTTSCTTSTGGSCVETALGKIPTEPAELVKWILGWSIAMGGGIAFLLSLWGGVTIILASGNPEKINEGKEIITSAVSGLLFIIFSVFLLRLIGVDILGILEK